MLLQCPIVFTRFIRFSLLVSFYDVTPLCSFESFILPTISFSFFVWQEIDKNKFDYKKTSTICQFSCVIHYCYKK